MYEIWIRVSHHQRLSDLPLPQTFSGLFLNFTALQYLKTIHKILYHPKFVWGYWLHGTLQFCALDVVDCKFVFQQESVSVKPSSWSEPVKAARSPRFQPEDGVLRRKIRRPFAITVFFHCLWVWKGRTDVSEPACRLGRGPLHHKQDKFGVSQAARSPRFQLNDGVLRREMRWLHVFMLFFHCLWVWKVRTCRSAWFSASNV